MMRRILVVLGILGISLVLAFPLRDAVYAMVIVPAAYAFWLLGLMYHSVHQLLWWSIVFVVVLVILIRGLLPQSRVKKSSTPRAKPIKGQVESLSVSLKKAERGIYSKWLIANRVGRIAFQILSQRQTGKQRSFFDPLTGSDWTPDSGVQSYLESGFHGSFADYPQKRRFFSPTVQTPLDHDVKEVIQYLESQIDNQ
jgi:hypothetical protein